MDLTCLDAEGVLVVPTIEQAAFELIFVVALN